MDNDPIGGPGQGPQIFISHSHDEVEIALAWKELIRATSDDRIRVWLSSDIDPQGGIPAGAEWADTIYERIAGSTHVLAVFTPWSLGRHWIWWECGVARGVEKKRKLVPVVHGMEVEDLPDPIRHYQAYSGDDPASVLDLCRRIVAAETREELREGALQPALQAFRGSVDPPPDPAGVLVDHGHGQAEWNWDRATEPSLLEIEFLREAVGSGHPVAVETIPSENELTPRRLRGWAGLVLAMPLGMHLRSEARDVIVDWVRRGGRLLLLGYELGDHHHGGNLNEVGRVFGLHFQSDIVTPGGWSRDSKPYGAMVRLPVAAEAHPVLTGIDELALQNVQTIRGEPGSRRLVGLGENRVGRPANPPEHVRYDDGTWRLFPREEMRFHEPDRAQGVFVEAPSGLTGRGRVLALGSWKLASGPGRDALAANLVSWLGRDSAARTQGASHLSAPTDQGQT